MALTKTVELITNFNDVASFPNAYIRVERVGMSKSSAYAIVSVKRSQDSESVLSTNRYEFIVSLEGDNPIKQAYNHLKTLHEFADAIDC